MEQALRKYFVARGHQMVYHELEEFKLEVLSLTNSELTGYLFHGQKVPAEKDSSQLRKVIKHSREAISETSHDFQA